MPGSRRRIWVSAQLVGGVVVATSTSTGQQWMAGDEKWKKFLDRGRSLVACTVRSYPIRHVLNGPTACCWLLANRPEIYWPANQVIHPVYSLPFTGWGGGGAGWLLVAYLWTDIDTVLVFWLCLYSKYLWSDWGWFELNGWQTEFACRQTDTRSHRTSLCNSYTSGGVGGWQQPEQLNNSLRQDHELW